LRESPSGTKSPADNNGSLANLLAMPVDTQPVAVLCIGKVPAFYPRPMFEDAGWGQRLPLKDTLFENRWPEDAEGTPTAY